MKTKFISYRPKGMPEGKELLFTFPDILKHDFIHAQVEPAIKALVSYELHSAGFIDDLTKEKYGRSISLKVDFLGNKL